VLLSVRVCTSCPYSYSNVMYGYGCLNRIDLWFFE
jgi:hypothetical protein